MKYRLKECPFCAGEVNWCSCGECSNVICANCYAVFMFFSPPDMADGDDLLLEQKNIVEKRFNTRNTCLVH